LQVCHVFKAVNTVNGFIPQYGFPVNVGYVDDNIILDKVYVRVGVSDDKGFCGGIISQATDPDIGKPLYFSDPGYAVVVFIKIKNCIGCGSIDPVSGFSYRVAVIVRKFVSPLSDRDRRALGRKGCRIQDAGQKKKSEYFHTTGIWIDTLNRGLKVTDFFRIYCRNQGKSEDHSCGNCFIGSFVDQDEASGLPVGGIGVKEQGFGCTHVDPSYFIHSQACAFMYLFKSINVQNKINMGDKAAYIPGIMFKGIFAVDPERSLVHPANHAVKFRCGFWQ